MAKNRFDFEAHLSRHPHNVSAGYTSSLTTGPIVPQYFHILGPGDTLYFTPKMFARLQDIVTAFFGEVDLHIEAFFVPMQMLYTPFGQIFTQTNDVISSLFVSSQPTLAWLGDKFPMMNTSNFTSDLNLTNVYYGHEDCIGRELSRLLDAFDMNPLCLLSQSNFETLGEQSTLDMLFNSAPSLLRCPDKISPWLFAAYQAIYQKCFRNDDIEKFDIGAYNVDRYWQDAQNRGFYNEQMTKLRYCQRPDDYFTSVKISPLSSAVNSWSNNFKSDSDSGVSGRFSVNGGSLNSVLEKVNDYLGFGSGEYRYQEVISDNSEIFPNSSSPTFSDNIGAFSGSSVGHDIDWYPTAANIRALFAVDKFVRIYGRAGKTYDEQIEAHFGIKIPHDVKHDITRIKHWRMTLNAEPIYSTSFSGSDAGSQLGQVGGQANNTLQAKQETFTAPVHGVFMIVAYANTKPRYFGTFSKLNLLTDRLSFPIPEFDKLGMQPLYGYECYPSFLASEPAEGALLNHNYMGQRIGWQRRYQEFKQKYNRTSLLYTNGKFLHIVPTDPSVHENIYAPYVMTRTPFDFDNFNDGLIESQESQLIQTTDLFESVHALDVVMAKEYDNGFYESFFINPQVMFQSDPILTDFYCEAKLVSWMSETGEPDL